MAVMTGAPPEYRLYTELAPWWPLISPPGQYAAEAAYLARILTAGARRAGEAGPAARPEVLDLGSGGGHVAVHLAGQVTLTLVDLSAAMLAVSRQLNPGAEHRQGDMRTVRLGREFDAVLVHDAVDYITTEADLALVIDTAYVHCRPGGRAVFVPDYTADTFRPVRGHGGGRDPSGRQASFREWTWDPDPADSWIMSEYEFVLTAADGTVREVAEEHRLGAFSRAAWARLVTEAGFVLEPGSDAPAAQGDQSDHGWDGTGPRPGRAARPAADPAAGSAPASRRPANLFIAAKPATAIRHRAAEQD
jgi:SAM-dependent methyltransferase